MRFTHSWPQLRRLCAVAAAGLAVALTAAACSSSSTSTPSSSGSSTPGTPASASSSALEKSSITVGALPIVDSAGLYVAMNQGYFKQAGLTVHVVPIVQSTSALPDMLHGSVDIVAGANYVSWFQAQAHGTASLKVLAAGTTCTTNTFGVLAMPSSGITKPADLSGKTIAVNLTDNVQTLTVNTLLKADGVNPASVHYVVVPFPDMITALKAHRVDAISAVEPFVTGAKAAGATQVLSECTGQVASFPLSGYFATSAWAQQYPNTARAFQKALEQGQAYAAANPQAVRQIIPTYTKITAAQSAALSLNTYPSKLDPAPLQRVATLMVTGGMLTKPLDVSSMLFH